VPPVKIALLDLNNGHPNEGMRGIKNIVEEAALSSNGAIESVVFDVRQKVEVPDLSYDIFISSGGPGNPLDEEGSEWEKKYFSLIDGIREHNRSDLFPKKYLFLICHSFQLYCRQYGYGKITARHSTSFGVMPIHKLPAARFEPLLELLPDPFYAVDSRDYQVVQPDAKKIESEGGTILCIEKYRAHVPLERAIMGIRFDEATVGFQFHPEADTEGMNRYLIREDKKNLVISKYGEEKYRDMLEYIHHEDKIKRTRNTILPAFLRTAIEAHEKVQA
jgi:homoserine O-succinyltransferase/O-acetyltransferase